MTPELRELIEAAKPFLSPDVVDETSGTIPLVERLRKAIEKVEEEIQSGPAAGG